jgi:hypothetical protein
VIGVLAGTAQKYVAESLVGRSGTARSSRTTSSVRRAVTPATVRLRPAAKSRAPTMSFTSAAPNEPVRGVRARSIARSNAFAVTGSFEGGEKRKPSRMVKV